MNLDSRIWVAGARGFVGSAIVRALQSAGYRDVLTEDRNLLLAPIEMMARLEPDYVFLAAARVGGIGFNIKSPADMLVENLQIQCNVIDAAAAIHVKKLLFLGSSCIYPRDATQPIPESALMTGPLEPTNKAYAMAKLAGIAMLDAYREQYGFRSVVAMPCNLYGPGDRFDPERSHFAAALMMAAHKAKVEGAATMPVWGTGKPRRELLHVDDLARACILLMNEAEGVVNVGAGEDRDIAMWARHIADMAAFDGPLAFDPSKPDGVPGKLLDSTRVRVMGWAPIIGPWRGLRETCDWYVANKCR